MLHLDEKKKKIKGKAGVTGLTAVVAKNVFNVEKETCPKVFTVLKSETFNWAQVGLNQTSSKKEAALIVSQKSRFFFVLLGLIDFLINYRY